MKIRLRTEVFILVILRNSDLDFKLITGSYDTSSSGKQNKLYYSHKEVRAGHTVNMILAGVKVA